MTMHRKRGTARALAILGLAVASPPSVRASSPSSPLEAAATHHPPPVPGVDWDGFGFGLNGVCTDLMWLDTVSVEPDPDSPSAASPYATDPSACLTPLGPLPLPPTATVLNYGQSLFEGLKAFRRSDGTIVLFRPDRNAARMADGARRFLLPAVDPSTFVGAVDEVVRANARWVPPYGKGALYVRPLLMGTGADLGVKPSHAATFCVYACPVGNYFKGALKAIKLQAVRGFGRAALGGAGNVKAAGNYAPAFAVQRTVRERGYDEVLCLDAATGTTVEEAGASNFFAVTEDGTLVTPSLDPGTILPGVTRASVLELAREECGCRVEERAVTLDELRSATEAFCCGTGASITPVGSVAVARGDGSEDEGAAVRFGDGATPGPLTQRLHKMLAGIQTGEDEGLSEKYRHWIHVVEPKD